MNTDGIFATNSLVWPLTFLLIALLLLRQVREDLRPIVSGMVGQLATQSQKYAMIWALALLVGFNSSMMALIDEAHKLGWGYLESAARVLAPGIGAVIGILKLQQAVPKSSGTPPSTP
ncbi:MAG: hypothetical protein JSR30_00025 [Proteobacteria bacterium]|nr:hypothetical protein [Pseudomonadota bacterium]